MQVEPGVLLQPSFDVGVLVRGVVVQDQVHLQSGWHFRVNGLEELQELDVAVLGQAGADDDLCQR